MINKEGWVAWGQSCIIAPMSKAGRQRQRERTLKRQAEIKRKERRRKLRNYAIIVLVIAVIGALFAAAAIADRRADSGGTDVPVIAAVHHDFG
jgi:beta-lactamase regulating signal transducer with metallopeptidase domain